MSRPHRSGVTDRLRRAVLLVPFAMLGACAVTSPLAISSAGTGLPSGSAIALDMPDGEPGDRSRMGVALGEAFARHAVTVAADAPYVADYAISIRNAEGGLSSTTNATEADAIEWTSRPRRNKLFDGCQAKRLRATLVMLDRQSGSRIYRGEGEATACGFSDAELASFADRLVSDALAKSAR